MRVRASVLAVAVLVATAMITTACQSCETPRPISPASSGAIDVGATSPDTPVSRDAAQAPSVTYEWSLEPAVLLVFRDTVVRLRVVPGGEAPIGATCAWDFGDGDTGAGCDVRHVFRGGLTDGWVTLSLQGPQGTTLASEKRKLPLERLPIAPLAEKEGDTPNDEVPAKPLDEDARRIVVIGPLHGAERLEAAVEAITERLHPDLVLHTGDLLPTFTEEAFAAWMRSFLTTLAAASIPVAVAAGELDVASPVARSVFASTLTQILFKPVLDFQDERGYPFRYSFLFGGTYVIVLDATTGDLSDEQFRWLKAELMRGAGYPRILVVSHFPPAPLTSTSTAALKRAYKVQELLLRYRGTLLLTGHEPVFYDGRFAQVHVVSSGGGGDECRPLAGETICQGTTLTVLDLVGKEPPRVYGVSGVSLDRRIAPTDLPARVDRYEREGR